MKSQRFLVLIETSAVGATLSWNIETNVQKGASYHETDMKEMLNDRLN